MLERVLQPLPDPGERGLPRYSTQPLPPYRYVPGLHPHPTRDPAGHSFRDDTHRAGGGIARAASSGAEAWRFGVDLFNRSFFWEAHEAWEELWRAAPAGSAERLLSHGLIQIAAALLKVHVGRHDAARRLAAAGIDKVRQAGASPRVLGVDPTALATAFDAYVAPLRAGRPIALGATVPVLRLDGGPPA